MDNERYLWLVMRNLAGEISEEEKLELEEFLKNSQSKEEKYRLLKKFWSQEVFYNHSADTQQALEKVMEKINAQDQGSSGSSVLFIRKFKKFAVAAVLLLAIGLGILMLYTVQSSTQEIALIEKYNGNGTRSMVTLSDGTRIWLNSDSKIKYPETFDEEIRNVYLEGEAFFKVAPNSSKPFFIHMNKARIKVIGTSFNVKAYPNEENIQTSVVTGKVAFITENHQRTKSDTLLLTKHNKVTYFKNSGEIKKEITNTNDDREWINGKLVFKSETLESISMQLERSFGKKISFRDNKLKGHRFTGTFDDSSLNEILFYLAMSKPFKYTETDSTLIIY